MKTFALTTVLVVAAVAGCDRSPPPAATKPSPGQSASAPDAGALPKGLFVDVPPAGAAGVKQGKAASKTGQAITLVGRIGGSDEPFVAKRSIFTLVDTALKACGEEDAEDTCPTPWDYCCEPRETITANSVTIQVVGADGQPMKTELNGVRGLKPLATVTVQGTVARAEGQSVVINAKSMHVKP